jgi:hypothetical protein
MVDDLSKRGPADRNRINLEEEWELEYWSQELGATADRVKQAVQAVGNSAAAVREYLQQQGRGGAERAPRERKGSRSSAQSSR